jgi:hypothetical protein
MKALEYETKVDLKAELRRLVFLASEHIRNHLNNNASFTQTLWMRAEKCVEKTTSNNYREICILVCASLFLAQQPNAGQGRLKLEISRSHTMRHHSR